MRFCVATAAHNLGDLSTNSTVLRTFVNRIEVLVRLLRFRFLSKVRCAATVLMQHKTGDDEEDDDAFGEFYDQALTSNGSGDWNDEVAAD